jgi:hypothetical protein
LLCRITTLFKGFSNVVVQPALIKVFAPGGSRTTNGDWLLNTSALPQTEYFYMVITTRTFFNGPRRSSTDPQSIFVFERAPVFTTRWNFSLDPTAVDAITPQLDHERIVRQDSGMTSGSRTMGEVR